MVYRISNFLLPNAKKVSRFIFGEFFVSCELNQRERIFEIRINKTLTSKKKVGDKIVETVHDVEDYVDIENFKKFWGPQWKIMYDSSEEA